LAATVLLVNAAAVKVKVKLATSLAFKCAAAFPVIEKVNCELDALVKTPVKPAGKLLTATLPRAIKLSPEKYWCCN